MRAYTKLFPAVIAVCMLVSCSQKYGIVRSTDAVDRIDVELKKEGCSVIRSIYSDIYIELVDSEKWEYLFKNHYFTNKDLKYEDYRYASLPFFHFVIRNTGREPVKVEKIEVSYGNKKFKSLTFKELKSMQKSPVYKIFNYAELFRNRRLLGENYCLKKIEYLRDTIPFSFDFIPPSDSILGFTAFNWIPVEHRKFKILFHIDYSGKKQVLSFDFQRFEYRNSGEDFRKPAGKKDLLKDEL